MAAHVFRMSVCSRTFGLRGPSFSLSEEQEATRKICSTAVEACNSNWLRETYSECEGFALNTPLPLTHEQVSQSLHADDSLQKLKQRFGQLASFISPYLLEEFLNRLEEVALSPTPPTDTPSSHRDIPSSGSATETPSSHRDSPPSGCATKTPSSHRDSPPSGSATETPSSHRDSPPPGSARRNLFGDTPTSHQGGGGDNVNSNTIVDLSPLTTRVSGTTCSSHRDSPSPASSTTTNSANTPSHRDNPSSTHVTNPT